MQIPDLANDCVVYLLYNPIRTSVSEGGIKMKINNPNKQQDKALGNPLVYKNSIVLVTK